MADILQTFWNPFSGMKIVLFWFKFVPKGLLNPLHAKFFRENINIYLHFVSYLLIDTTQVVEILPQIRQEPTYFT